jgi:hypothetical protein
LTIIEVGVYNCVGLEDVGKVVMGKQLHVVKGSLDVHVDGFVDVLGEVGLGISFAMDVLCLDLCCINLENFDPEALSFALYVLYISSEQALLDNWILQDFIHIFIELE